MRPFAWVLVFGLLGCATEATEGTVTEPPADSDGDGVSDADEAELGLDPNSDDSDGDGLSDGDELAFGSDPLLADADADLLDDSLEFELGCDPNNPDTDGDDYLDGWEYNEGSDPADAGSVIYKGGWPYNPDKIDGPNNPSHAVGEKFPRWAFKDQFGDRVDMYDFSNQGKYIIIDTSAQWCPPCMDMADWLDGHNDSYESTFPGLRDKVNADEVYWITIMGEANDGSNPTKKTATEWYDDFPHDKVPVLADAGRELQSHIRLQYWPSLILLDQKMRLVLDQDSFYDGVGRELD
ncbi:MAG: thiol-disulfide isomerase/thioredoxin [Myxococcota bacterium]|jgi:thiol-disulfide isomerase/thioredoxin